MSILLLALLAAAPEADAATTWRASPRPGGEPVVVVRSPGFGTPAFLPLVHALVDTGADVVVVEFDCGGQRLADLADELVEAVGEREGVTLVAHGIGATVALAATPRMDVGHLVLLAPVLDVWPVAVTEWLADRPVGPSVSLEAPLAWNGTAVQDVLLGGALPLGCAPAPLVAEAGGWVRAGAIPLDLEAVDVPVWMAVSAGDDVATLEAAVPASRRLPDRQVVRLGLARLDRQDYTHAELLVDPVAVKAAVRAVRRGPGTGYRAE